MNRRQLALAAAAATAFAPGMDGRGTAAAADTDLQGYRMPDEGEAHVRTWMGLTSSTHIWGGDLPSVQADLMRIADAVAAFEPVTMLVNATAMARANALRARAANAARIELMSAALDDLWLRDTGPVFVRHVGRGALRALDFNFNAWGGKQAHAQDARVAATIAERAGIALVKRSLVLEGGALEVDGEGTAIVKESCVLNANRNPGRSKATVEQMLKDSLGLTKVIWLPGPAGGDITDAHTDLSARFAGAGRVVVSHDAQDTYGERSVTQAHIDTLRRSTDALGRALALTIIPVPTEPASPKADSDSFAAGYINYYLCNGGLILPSFGDTRADRRARDALQALYPARRLVQMRIDAIAAGGGGIHCTTQQQPAAAA
jgi:agmatine deiminase